MKFSDMTYERPNIEQASSQFSAIAEKITAAANAKTQITAFEKYITLSEEIATMATLAYIRHTVNTKDEFYDKENEFIDENMPLLEEPKNEINSAMLNSHFRKELESYFGTLFFKNLEIEARTFKPEMVELMQEENRLENEYQKLYAGAMVEFNGETIPLPKLGPYKESSDKETRRRAYEAEGKFFDDHRKELDDIFDKLVHNRNKQGKILGYDNFLQLGYDRLGRNCYDKHDIAKFRDQIAADLVPIVAKVYEAKNKRIGTDKAYYADTDFNFPDGNPVPNGTADDILKAGQEMYRSLSPETGEFIDFMFENDLFDVLSSEGKAPGGYCTEIPKYKAPFIFSNFNGTSGDIDVLTHEAGHAFQGFRAFKKDIFPFYREATMETCECHSMAMEFLTAPYHRNFFGKDAAKYQLSHCEHALVFIPYGCMVDEFQHLMYENPDLTPEERNKTWLELEAKYRPYLDFDGLPFYSRGAGWQRQLHIYLYPLYYIDYCMAQTVAFQFLLLSLKNREEAWAKYLEFVDYAGTMTFEEIIKKTGLKLPYEQGCIKEIGEATYSLLK